MKYKLKIFAISVFAVLLTSFSFAQDKTIKGIVTAFDGIPIEGAKVKISSSNETVTTDSLGMFTALVENEDRLRVRANGFYNQKVDLTENIRVAAINLEMKPGSNRAISLGYGQFSNQNDGTNAVEAIDNNDIDFSQYSSIYEIINGRFSGVEVQNGEIIVRGQQSINASNAALIVVDNIMVSNAALLDAIPTTDIRSINIIKDGSAAMYGSRGGNGVVVIETKSGSE